MPKQRLLLLIVWIVAIVATIGSLYFSEVLKLPPCVLCWYQRIFMYPLVLLIGVGLLLGDIKKLPYYILPLSLVGFGIATYHVMLYYGIIPESLAPCVQGVSCTTKQIEWFGFITIPLLSWLAFLKINACLILALMITKKESYE